MLTLDELKLMRDTLALWRRGDAPTPHRLEQLLDTAERELARQERLDAAEQSIDPRLSDFRAAAVELVRSCESGLRLEDLRDALAEHLTGLQELLGLGLFKARVFKS